MKWIMKLEVTDKLESSRNIKNIKEQEYKRVEL